MNEARGQGEVVGVGDGEIGDGESSETRSTAESGILQQLIFFLFTRYGLCSSSMQGVEPLFPLD